MCLDNRTAALKLQASPAVIRSLNCLAKGPVSLDHSMRMPCTLRSHLLDHKARIKCFSSDFTHTLNEVQGKNSALLSFAAFHFLFLQALALYQNNSLGFEIQVIHIKNGQPFSKAHLKASNWDDTRRLPQQDQTQGHGWDSLLSLQLSKRHHSVFCFALKNVIKWGVGCGTRKHLLKDQLIQMGKHGSTLGCISSSTSQYCSCRLDDLLAEELEP